MIPNHLTLALDPRIHAAAPEATDALAELALPGGALRSPHGVNGLDKPGHDETRLASSTVALCASAPLCSTLPSQPKTRGIAQ
jgi:hypothetical protein